MRLPAACAAGGAGSSLRHAAPSGASSGKRPAQASRLLTSPPFQEVTQYETTAAGLTQIGELSFILVEVARKSGLVGEEVFTATLAASLLSIFLNVFIVRAVMKWVDPKLPAEKMATA